MNILTNCKNCGAVLTGSRCEYCGTDYGKLYTKNRELVQEDRTTLRVFEDGQWKWVDEAMPLPKFGVCEILSSQFGVYKI